MEKGYQYMKTAAGLASRDGATHSTTYGVDGAHLALVKYCDNYLRMTEEGMVCAIGVINGRLDLSLRFDRSQRFRIMQFISQMRRAL